MKKLKYLIFGLRNTLIEAEADSSKGQTDFNAPFVKSFSKLLAFARKQGIEPVVFANHAWQISGKSAEEVFTPTWGKMKWLTATQLGWPSKPQAAAMEACLKHLKCDPNEVLYIGNTEIDMRTAVNGSVLFLNATWINESIDYGFKFKTPKEIAKFIDVFCVRSKEWSFSVEDSGLRFYSLAPFSTMKKEYEGYSADARSTKEGFGHAEFWGRYIAATLFLTGLYQDIDYMAPFPRSKANKWNEPLKDSLNTFAQCFRIRYLPDLIVRHTESPKSQYNSSSMTHQHHLNTILLKKKPIKNIRTGDPYANSPLRTGKTVLVVDDICTQGRSTEAARVYIEATGAKVVLLSWLKTINRPFVQITSTNGFKFDPYKATNWDGAKLTTKVHQYNVAMTDDEAYKELQEKFEAYDKWDWPAGL